LATKPQPVVPFDGLRELIPPPATRHPQPIRKWAVGVTTAPRPRPTLDACLGNLTRAGWESPHLFMDSAVRVSGRFGHLPGTLRSPAAGAWPNHYPTSRPCLVSLYCSSAYSAREFGWQPLPSQWTWGALAFVFPRRVAQGFLLDPLVCKHRWGRWREEDGGLANTDLVIGWWASRKRIPVWYPTPSLVQHIGVTSTLGADLRATGERRADRWAGSLISSSRTVAP
jgi:hypothetical protein